MAREKTPASGSHTRRAAGGAGGVRRRAAAGAARAGARSGGSSGGSSDGARYGGTSMGGSSMLQFYTEDAPGLKVSPTMVLVMSLGYIGFVVLLHVWGKIRG
eukprot:PLAT11684.1.p1 GENE.PLAT11684.1~~PLAT11684.1.p1  ORF type:complete len:115 (+),score=33.64 PLAT11684.1:42-347(+)